MLNQNKFTEMYELTTGQKVVDAQPYLIVPFITCMAPKKFVHDPPPPPIPTHHPVPF